ncbi:MAG: hypothetical protein ACKESB_03620 [Candidatus Hodgkinia cicadicola]
MRFLRGPKQAEKLVESVWELKLKRENAVRSKVLMAVLKGEGAVRGMGFNTTPCAVFSSNNTSVVSVCCNSGVNR